MQNGYRYEKTLMPQNADSKLKENGKIYATEQRLRLFLDMTAQKGNQLYW